VKNSAGGASLVIELGAYLDFNYDLPRRRFLRCN